MFITTKRHEAKLAAKDALIAEKDRTIAEVAEDRDHWQDRFTMTKRLADRAVNAVDEHLNEIERLRGILAGAYVHGAKGRIVKYVESGK